MENDSRLLYNRAGQIPLALSEIEHGEQRTRGSLVLPYQRERVSSTNVTNPPGEIEQAHTHIHCGRQLGEDVGCTHCFSHTEDNRHKQTHTHTKTHSK